MGAIIIASYFIFPALLCILSIRYRFINKIGIVVFTYAGGLLLGIFGLVPDSVTGIQTSLAGFTILVGIPLVLFSENIIKWTKMAKTTFISLLLGVASVVILVFVGYFIFREKIPEIWKVSGMMIGIYTGGTANLAAIARGLNVDQDLFILTHTVELAIGALILLFLITAAKPLFGLFMKPYKSTGNQNNPDLDVGDFESYEGFFKRSSISDILKAFGISLVIFGAGFGLMTLFEGDTKFTVGVLTVTTLGILVSLVPSVNKMKRSFQLGMYFIYIFCMIVASQADIVSLFNPESRELLINMFLFIALVIVGSLVVHSLLSWLFGISVDDYVITSTALANSPPFVPVVAAAMRNKEVVIPGMIIGVIGYAIGNYLGVAIAYLLR